MKMEPRPGLFNNAFPVSITMQPAVIIEYVKVLSEMAYN